MGRETPLADRIWAMIVEARDDIRQKVVEEPWFGRPVTEKLADIHGALDQAQGREQDLSPSSGKNQPATPEPSLDPGRDYGIDR